MEQAPTLSALILGPSGHGKSWLGSTTPSPRLIFDLEGRARFSPSGKKAVFWDGSSDPMKLGKSATSTYVVDCTRSIDPMAEARQWLRSGKHPFVSVTVDSLMEAQYQEAQKIVPGTKQFRTQDWGMLLRIMEQLVRDIVDLTRNPRSKIRCVVLIAGVTTKDGYIKPLMQGQITTKVPYWVDMVGYLEKVRLETGKTERRLWLDQRKENDLEVKDGTDDIIGKFGGQIVIGERDASPNMTDFFLAVGGN